MDFLIGGGFLLCVICVFAAQLMQAGCDGRYSNDDAPKPPAPPKPSNPTQAPTLKP